MKRAIARAGASGIDLIRKKPPGTWIRVGAGFPKSERSGLPRGIMPTIQPEAIAR
jgi:hypothetical protein